MTEKPEAWARKFEIWSEGYRAQGNESGAHKHGEAEGENFVDACRNFFADEKPDEMGWTYFDAERNTYWGCRLFDNEGDARQSYG